MPPVMPDRQAKERPQKRAERSSATAGPNVEAAHNLLLRPQLLAARRFGTMTDKTTDNQPRHGAEHLQPFSWSPGQSGNPKGRPKGSRSKLTEDYLFDLYEDWKTHGRATIAKVREDKPEIYLQVVSKLIPKDIKIEVPQLQKIVHEIIDVTDIQDTGGPGGVPVKQNSDT